jgi:hypothetical protein
MQLCLQRSCRSGLHRSSGLQRAQAIRMTTDGSATLVALSNKSFSCAVFLWLFAGQAKHRSMVVTLRTEK